MFIQTEETPNPSTLKFMPGRAISPGDVRDYRKYEDARDSPLARRLFGVPGVVGVFLGDDFIAVTKGDREWPHLKPAVLGTIMEHFLSGAPVLGSDAPFGQDKGESYDKGDENIVKTIKELLETRVQPAVARDGGHISFRGFRDGVVFLDMQGACAGCPSSTATLKHGIETLLRHFIPEVSEVRPL
ncbi:MAG: NifU family protein [Hyphomicrobiales bacterium]